MSGVGVGVPLRAPGGFPPRGMGKSGRVPRWQMEEARIVVQSETSLVGQEGAQGAKYPKEQSNTCCHLCEGKELPVP